MPTSSSALQSHIESLLERDPPRAKSLCVTLLGDALLPHGGSIWLGDLIELMRPLGINERLLRTSAFRLTAEGWLRSERDGRRSRYALSDQGLRWTEHASQRIYDGPSPDWDGTWTLVVLPRTAGNGLAERTELRRQLAWEGFGALAPGVYAHPQVRASTAHAILDRLGIPDKALVLSARDLADAGGLPIAALVAQCWNLEELAGQYRSFIADYGPLEKSLRARPAPQLAFATRALLLHRWRRIVLHDPQLPPALLPADWPGLAARRLCARLYWMAFAAAEEHLNAVAGRDNDRYRPLSPQAYRRFGGAPPEVMAAQAA
jgi:phenylacetic acid degradation operon negative regulatory protein PaaX